MKAKIWLAVFLIILAGSGLFSWNKKIWLPQQSKVLGTSDQADIYISDGYSEQALINLTSEEEPAIHVRSHKITGQAKITLYEASIDDLLFYLVHDDEDKQVHPSVEVNKLKHKASFDQEIMALKDNRILLPLDHSGIWVVRLQIDDVTRDSFILRSRIGSIAKDKNDKILIWSQFFKDGKTLRSGGIKVYDLGNKVKKIETSSIKEEGIAEISKNDKADIVVVEAEGELTIVPLNIKKYSKFTKHLKVWKYFVLTDRPIYKPGDTLSFSAIVREDDDARYTLATGKMKASIYHEWVNDDNLLMEKTVSSDDWGVASGKFELPTGLRSGNYVLRINSNEDTGGGSGPFGENWENGNIYFKVEYYEKPEYHLSLESSDGYLVSGDKTTVKLKGSYFFGQPLAGKEVKYKVFFDDYYDYWWYSDESEPLIHGYWGNGNEKTSGKITLSEKGEAEIPLDARLNDQAKNSQVMTISAEYQDESGVPVNAQKSILVRRGEFGLEFERNRYNYRLDENAEINLKLRSYKGASIDNKILKAQVKRRHWIREQSGGQAFPNYREEKEDIGKYDIKTDKDGKARLDIKIRKPGSYEIIVDTNDSRGNLMSKSFHFWVPEDSGFYYDYDNSKNSLSLMIDKETYEPQDKATISISSVAPDRDVFVTLERGGVNRYQIIKLNGETAKAEFQLQDTDMPNIFVRAVTFSKDDFFADSENIIVSTQQKKMKIAIDPDKEKYAPGDKIELNIHTTDQGGNPVAAELTVSMVDKAIFELTDSNRGSIFDTFWNERYNQTRESHSLERIVYSTAEMGGCFPAETAISMADGSTRPISEIKVGDMVRTKDGEGRNGLKKGKVLSVHKTKSPGYLIINGELRITPNHKLLVNDKWDVAGNIEIGDALSSENNEKVFVFSVEWQAGAFDVYNLEVDKYHTFFAQNIWVHNEKGGGSERSAFQDTAYFNPSVRTESDGRAKISFRLPDNLTTWVISAVGATKDTMVGETAEEILVTKKLVLRPVLPNVLYLGDEIELSALVHNFTLEEKDIKVDLNFENGEITDPARNIKLSPKGFEQIFWKVRPKIVSQNSKIKFSAVADKDLSDIVIQEIPVKEIGYWETDTLTGNNEASFPIKFHGDTNTEISSVKLSIGASLFGRLPSAYEYLINYPYGCIEQTTSRFVPVVIAKKYPALFKELTEGKPLDEMIKKGFERLIELQSTDGGWAWYSGESSPFITAYVVEYLEEARMAGVETDEKMSQMARNYLLNKKKQTDLNFEDKVSVIYALSRLNEAGGKEEIKEFNDLGPDLLAYAVMANKKYGFNESAEKGLKILVEMRKEAGSAANWESGSDWRFGSREASTALAIRAILEAGNDKQLAIKGARYLSEHKTKPYWGNSFGTAQVMRAMAEYVNLVEDENPDYSYKVSIDGVQKYSGKMTKFTDLKMFDIPTKDVKTEGSEIKIVKEGAGQMYSDLNVKEFRRDRQEPPASKELSIKRQYNTNRNEGESLQPGDIVEVALTLDGELTDGNYMIIEDYLPSGLVPVNVRLKNEQSSDTRRGFGYMNQSYVSSFMDYRLDGINIYLEHGYRTRSTYRYLARVVANGTFEVSPATASLMYRPEVSARTKIGNFKEMITYGVNFQSYNTGLPSTVGIKQPQTFKEKISASRLYLVSFIVVALAILTSLSIAGYLIYKKIKSRV